MRNPKIKFLQNPNRTHQPSNYSHGLFSKGKGLFICFRIICLHWTNLSTPELGLYYINPECADQLPNETVAAMLNADQCSRSIKTIEGVTRSLDMVCEALQEPDTATSSIYGRSPPSGYDQCSFLKMQLQRLLTMAYELVYVPNSLCPV